MIYHYFCKDCETTLPFSSSSSDRDKERHCVKCNGVLVRCPTPNSFSASDNGEYREVRRKLGIEIDKAKQNLKDFDQVLKEEAAKGL
jgi:hypothetical protein